jgi:hypothetical protein
MAEKIMNTPCIRLNGEFWFPAKAIFMTVIGFSYTGIPTTSNLANKVGREHVKNLDEFLPADQSKLTIAYYAWSEYRSQKVELKRL